MKIHDTSTPVVLINCKLAALGVMRSLGSLGVTTYGVDADSGSPAMLSRYCADRFQMSLTAENNSAFLEYLMNIGARLGRRAILIPTSDETSVFVAEHAETLIRHYIFPQNKPELVTALMHKKDMYYLAKHHNVPTACTEFPKSLSDVQTYVRKAVFPVMVKGILGNLLALRTGVKMAIVHTPEELIETYKRLEDPASPNLMFQEYIPGGDDQIYIFNGYFNEGSECLAAFTGHKIRQFPVHVGCSSLGICKWNKDVADITTRFMKAVGYKGILDIGYRFDARDGQYKVLDINPRIGQAFRLFLSNNGMDVARALYQDLTGQKTLPIKPREGRKWIIEDFDVVSSYHYYKEGSLTFGSWLKSFRGVEEGAWFSVRDPLPFLIMAGGLIKKYFVYMAKRLGLFKR
ncbi:MAG: hypothetical protein AABY45_05390 [Deltaproteobacteria bacterium]